MLAKSAYEPQLRECMAINKKYSDIWFKTSNKNKVDALIDLGCLFVGLLHSLYTNNMGSTMFILNKYNAKFNPNVDAVYDEEDRIKVRGLYLGVLREIRAAC